jgi:hypothetical protein
MQLYLYIVHVHVVSNRAVAIQHLVALFPDHIGSNGILKAVVHFS